MKIAALIQARMGSTRLPGKSMLPIGGKPLIEHVVDNVRQVVPDVYLITTPDSTEIIEFARSNGIPYSLDRYPRNVLDSYYHCAESNRIEHIVRVTGDNPLIRPETVRKVTDFYLSHDYDWVANCRLKTTYPVGDDLEVFSFKALEKAWRETSQPYEREHVTPYIYRNPELFKLYCIENDRDLSHISWTVDTLEDYERVKEIYENNDERYTRIHKT